MLASVSIIKKYLNPKSNLEFEIEFNKEKIYILHKT